MKPVSSSKKYSYTQHLVISPGRKEIPNIKNLLKSLFWVSNLSKCEKSKALHEQEPGVGKVCWSRAALTGSSSCKALFQHHWTGVLNVHIYFNTYFFSFLKQLFILMSNTQKGVQILNGDRNLLSQNQAIILTTSL